MEPLPPVSMLTQMACTSSYHDGIKSWSRPHTKIRRLTLIIKRDHVRITDISDCNSCLHSKATNYLQRPSMISNATADVLRSMSQYEQSVSIIVRWVKVATISSRKALLPLEHGNQQPDSQLRREDCSHAEMIA